MLPPSKRTSDSSPQPQLADNSRSAAATGPRGLLTRRNLLLAGSATAAAIASPVVAAPTQPASRSLRIAHLTDLHLQPERQAARGVSTCLEHVHALPDQAGGGAVDLVITGGDTIMDALEAGRDRTKLQWDLWQKTKADHCSLDVRSVIGNHDVWGWTKSKAGTTGAEPGYGKAWACEAFGREARWESFDRGGWHIVLLDSTFPHQESYIAKLDEPQWEWLEQDLGAVPATTPILIVTHIPILSIHPLAAAEATAAGTAIPAFAVNGNLVHVDQGRFQQLFARHPNVKACLSGHLHIVDDITYGGVRYLCNGAVAAGWWRGLHHGTDYGYAVVDLFDDGTVARQYVPYGWTTQA
jgi:Icc protein